MFESVETQRVCAAAYNVMFDRLSQDHKDEAYSFVEAFCQRSLTPPPRNLYPLGCSWLRVSSDNEASVYAYAFFGVAIQRMNEKAVEGLRFEPVPKTPLIFGYNDSEHRETACGLSVMALDPKYLCSLVEMATKPGTELYVAWSFKDPVHKTSEFGTPDDVSCVLLAHTDATNPRHVFVDVVSTCPEAHDACANYVIENFTRTVLPASCELFYDVHTAFVPRRIVGFEPREPHPRPLSSTTPQRSRSSLAGEPVSFRSSTPMPAASIRAPWVTPRGSKTKASPRLRPDWIDDDVDE